MKTVFHILQKSDLALAIKERKYTPADFEKEGFIHLSEPSQVLESAQKFFAGKKDLRLWMIAADKLGDDLKYESSDPESNKLYPHLYCPFETSAIEAEYPLVETTEGFQFPSELGLKNGILVRPALPGDESEIASVHTHGWLQAYQGIIPEDFLSKCPLGFRNRYLFWKKTLICSPSPKMTTSEQKELFLKTDFPTVFVAETSDLGVVGFCSVERAREKEMVGYGEISSLYLLQEFKHKGIGRTLFEMGQNFLRSMGLEKSYLWVLKENPTVEFYKKSGGIYRPDLKKTANLGKSLEKMAFEWSLNG